ncbi:hypothetical protein ACHAXH_005910 [Discostella pseudostelligera]|jgi:hypothetical protein
MGKKRTSTVKKKQLAKKNRLSSTYGVSVLKGGTIARNNGVLESKLTSIDGSSSTRKSSGTSCDGVQNATNANTTSSAQNHGSSDRQTPGTRHPMVRNSERDEFQHLHASLEERSLAVQARKDEQRQMKKIRRNGRQMIGFGKFARSSTTFFAPATLTLAPKTTQELVDDATNQVSQGMNEIGRHATEDRVGGASAIPGQSSLAAAASLNWKIRVSNVNNQAPSQEHDNNPYAALDNDSDSDNSWAENNRKVEPRRFQFKPASFSFQPTVPDIPAVASCSGEDIDPDL